MFIGKMYLPDPPQKDYSLLSAAYYLDDNQFGHYIITRFMIDLAKIQNLDTSFLYSLHPLPKEELDKFYYLFEFTMIYLENKCSNWNDDIFTKKCTSKNESEENKPLLYRLIPSLEKDIIDVNASVVWKEAIRLLKDGMYARGGGIIRRYILDNHRNMEMWAEASTGRAKQKAKATRPRADALQKLIENIVENNVKVSNEQVLELLRSLSGKGVIECVTETHIEWTDKNHPAAETLITALKDRVSRAKKKIQK